MLKIGDKAPDFTHLDQRGEKVSLSDYAGKKVLVWFFPKANTPGCTAEGCDLRDHYDVLQSKDLEIIGISKDSVKKQKNFATKYEFPYPMLSDEEGSTINAFGCWGAKKFMGREFDGILRKSFLISKEGTIERIYDKVKTKTHGADVLADL